MYVFSSFSRHTVTISKIDQVGSDALINQQNIKKQLIGNVFKTSVISIILADV